MPVEPGIKRLGGGIILSSSDIHNSMSAIRIYTTPADFTEKECFCLICLVSVNCVSILRLPFPDVCPPAIETLKIRR